MSSIEFLGEGASLARPPAFNWAAYMYWKERMLIFLEACSLDILEAVIDGPFVPTIAGTCDSSIPKPISDWVSNCKTAKEMWDTLQQTHEGTTDVKRAQINMLMHEYELFNMKKEESVNDMQTRFTHIIIAIAESKDLGSMSIATLFGKLREHEMELHRLSEAEQTDRKRKWLSLKAQAHQTKSEQEICTDDSNNGGYVKYDDNNKGKILGIGDIGNESTTVIKDVLYVKDLKHNLISISQLCDKGFQKVRNIQIHVFNGWIGEITSREGEIVLAQQQVVK
uniref:Uncharacterized protein LOC105852681 n=1 Tax=Cicer arietinum TaxID=3827 RepID=A0A1S3EGP8_CICAR|nr:uncharacterized protein LOC105852681 [Cicer arietinum]